MYKECRSLILGTTASHVGSDELALTKNTKSIEHIFCHQKYVIILFFSGASNGTNYMRHHITLLFSFPIDIDYTIWNEPIEAAFETILSNNNVRRDETNGRLRFFFIVNLW